MRCMLYRPHKLQRILNVSFPDGLAIMKNYRMLKRFQKVSSSSLTDKHTTGLSCKLYKDFSEFAAHGLECSFRAKRAANKQNIGNDSAKLSNFSSLIFVLIVWQIWKFIYPEEKVKTPVQ